MFVARWWRALALVCLAGCAAAAPGPLTAPAPANPDELYFCVLAQLNELGYRVRRSDRTSGLVEARSIRPHGKATNFEPLYDEITVAVSHDVKGDIVHVTATDRRHGETLLKRCAAPR